MRKPKHAQSPKLHTIQCACMTLDGRKDPQFTIHSVDGCKNNKIGVLKAQSSKPWMAPEKYYRCPKCSAISNFDGCFCERGGEKK